METGMEMERSTPSSIQPPPTLFSLFVDTNLDTHLAMVVFSDDTVADLKGKIRTEHALCFKKIGEVSVLAVKLKHGEYFYHLLDSMYLKTAFHGTTGIWVLHLDLAPTTDGMKSQIETAGAIIEESGGQPTQRNVLQSERYSGPVTTKGKHVDQDFEAVGLSVKKDLIQASTSGVNGRGTLSDTLSQASLDRCGSLLPIGSSPQAQNLAISTQAHSFGAPSVELERRATLGVLVSEGDGVVGSNHQLSSEQVAGEGSKDKKEGENHGCVGGAAEVDVAIGPTKKEKSKRKKEKSRKRIDSLQSDQVLDGTSEHHHHVKKKKGKHVDQDFEAVGDSMKKDLIQASTSGVNGRGTLSDTLSQASLDRCGSLLPIGSSPQAQNLAISTQAHSFGAPSVELERRATLGVLVSEGDGVVGSNHQLSSEQVAGEGSKDKKEGEHHGCVGGAAEVDVAIGPTKKEKSKRKKEKSRKRIDSLQSDQVLDGTSEHHHHVKKKKRKKEKHWSSEVAVKHPFTGHSLESVDVLPENSLMAKHDTNLASTKSHVDSLLQQTSMNDKQKRKKKKKNHVSKIDEAAQDELTCVVPNKVDGALKKQAIVDENPLEGGANIHTALEKEFNADFIDVTDGSSIEINMTDLISTKPEHLNYATESTFISSPNGKKQKHSEKRSEKIEHHHHNYNLRSSTRETVNSSRNQLLEDFSKGAPSRHLELHGKEPREAATLGKAVDNSIATQSIIPSDPSSKKSKCRRKKSENTVHTAGQPISTEPVRFGVDEVIKNPEEPSTDNQDEASAINLELPVKEHMTDNQNEASAINIELPVKEPTGSAVFGEEASAANLARVDPTVPLRPGDKTSKHGIKKSGKTEFPMDEYFHNVAKKYTKTKSERKRERVEQSVRVQQVHRSILKMSLRTVQEQGDVRTKSGIRSISSEI